MINCKIKTVFWMSVLVCTSSVLYAQEIRSIGDENEVLVYRNIHADGSERTSRTRFFPVPGAIKGGIAYTNADEVSAWEVHTDLHGVPSLIKYSEKGNSLVLIFDGTGKVRVKGNWKGKEIDLAKTFSPTVTLENAAVARSLDFTSNTKYVFDLLQTDKLPQLVPYRMYFRVVGEEIVTVPAGTFRCKKIQFSLKDWRTLFYKAYYYISDDEKRIIVKIDNVPKGGSSELTAIE
ncbi:MAG: DUF3108 domain-containing protein [Spirochaetales bacterium]|nr:DUF3108 domain-containing protein [Spirochaetales bacterium]